MLRERTIEGPARNLWINATTLIVMGLVLMIAEWAASQKRELGDLNLRDGLIIGGFQCLALIPGSSRSGSTITGGLFAGQRLVFGEGIVKRREVEGEDIVGVFLLHLAGEFPAFLVLAEAQQIIGELRLGGAGGFGTSRRVTTPCPTVQRFVVTQ